MAVSALGAKRAQVLLQAFRSSRRLNHDLVKVERFIHVSDEVRRAVEMAKPVVALETTIYTHGLGRDSTPVCQPDLVVHQACPFHRMLALPRI